MIVYRITNSLFKDDLSGSGASLYGGRWNSAGNSVLYCTEHISLAVLEIVVNFNKSESPIHPRYHLLEIDIPESQQVVLKLHDLKKEWTLDEHYSQFIGDEFLRDHTSLILKVPSSVVPEEHNYLLNPAHKDFKKIKIIRQRLYSLDRRLVV